eukprot:TRINITY_DN31176_c0_g1_i1.p1 TRINITY_DN31176_c0_g1~~TRINITY_DN31176_c0_g1_i1.p1  ORF type:complete len:293 (+),score=25.45 TRINITY_DN31176_c0_g1_i1:141-1019(+)
MPRTAGFPLLGPTAPERPKSASRAGLESETPAVNPFALARLKGRHLQVLHRDASTPVVRARPLSAERIPAQLRPPSASRQEPMLLPLSTKNLLCNWSACGDGKVQALLHALEKLWGRANDTPQGAKTFYDLGCGDGRVVLEVCKAFPTCMGVGIDLNPQLVSKASERARASGIADRCQFRVGDITEAALADADAVFFYFPQGALGTIVRRVLMRSDIRPGTPIFSADAPLWQPVSDTFAEMGVCEFCEEDQGLYRYTWWGGSPSEDVTACLLKSGLHIHRASGAGWRMWRVR